MRSEVISRAVVPFLLLSALAISGCPDRRISNVTRLDSIGTIDSQSVEFKSLVSGVRWVGDSLVVDGPPIGSEYRFDIESDFWGAQSVIVDGHDAYRIRENYGHVLDPLSAHVIRAYKDDATGYAAPIATDCVHPRCTYTFGNIDGGQDPKPPQLRITITMQAGTSGPYYDPPGVQ